MNREELDFFKKLLLEERDEIIKEILEADESVKDLFNNSSYSVNDNADDAANNITHNIINIVNNTSNKTLAAIDAALRRIEEETFGNCVSCNDEIKTERLKAIPWATMCIDCINKREKRN